MTKGRSPLESRIQHRPVIVRIFLPANREPDEECNKDKNYTFSRCHFDRKKKKTIFRLSNRVHSGGTTGEAHVLYSFSSNFSSTLAFSLSSHRLIHKFCL
jgi:hypothetical protein